MFLLPPARVVSGSRDTTLRVWDVLTGRCEHVLTGHVAAVRCVQYNGRRVVSGGYDYLVKVWDPETEVCLFNLQGHTNRVYSLQVSMRTQTHTSFTEEGRSEKVWAVWFYGATLERHGTVRRSRVGCTYEQQLT